MKKMNAAPILLLSLAIAGSTLTFQPSAGANPQTGASERKAQSVAGGSPAIKNNFVISGNLTARYEVITEAMPMDASLNLTAVYAWFDDLAARFPDYVTRSLLATEASGLPVYIYRFKPPITGKFSETLPKILHVNGIHGSEKESLGSGMRFYKDLCDHWQENELLSVFRWNVEFIVIPAFNAYGVQKDTRNNANRVNLNRNFPNSWKYSDVPYDASGPKPLSEPEAQALMDFLRTEEGIVFAIDHHRFNPWDQMKDPYTIWTGTKNDTLNMYLSGWSRDVQADFVRMHPELAIGNKSRIWIPESYLRSGRGWLSHSFSDAGITGTILEISRDSALNDFHTNSLGKLFAFALKEIVNAPDLGNAP